MWCACDLSRHEVRAMTRRTKKPYEDERYVVTVWDHEGGIVKKLWDATYEEAEEVREHYEDDPLKTVIVEERD
jgi:hypothetical protein